MTTKLATAALGLALTALTGALPTAAAAASEGDPIARLSDRAGSVAAGALAPVANRLLHPVAAAGTASITYDDGEADNGFGPRADRDDFFDAVMLFDLPRAGMDVDRVAVCLQRLGADADLDLELTFWAADGPGGEPGTLLDFIAATALGVPQGPNGAFFNFDLSALGVNLPDAQAYLGVGWDGAVDREFFVCADHDRPAVRPGYFDLDQEGTWTDLTLVDADYTALLLRGVFSDDFVPTDCVPDATTLCLNGGRFQVEADWATTQGTTGPAMALPLTDDTGGFWFFNEQNYELLIKVLNACGPPFERYWVFAGGLTNVEVDITVTDTETGQVNPYRNPQETPFQPIQDTDAFATCP